MCDVPELQAVAAMLHKYLGGRTNDKLTCVEVGSRDVNPGNGAYRDIIPKAWEYTGLDVVPGINVTLVVSDPHDWSEVPNESADVVVSGSCLEHTEYMWAVASEIGRITKPDGTVILCAPSMGHIHDYLIDCWRILPDGMRVLAKWSGLVPVEITTVQHPDWMDTLMVARKPNGS